MAEEQIAKIKNHRICFCIVGWHFPSDFLSAMEGFNDADIYIVSHQAKTPQLDGTLSVNGRFQVLWEPNRGYDWGAFEQFRRSGKWRSYDYIFFIHDDVRIKSHDLVAQVLLLLKKHYVVGNGRVTKDLVTPSMAAESYAHAQWKPPSADFRHDAVRGSFFAVRRCVLELDHCFEVFWDRFRVTSNCGNWSTRASCAKWQHAFGDSCFGFLSDSSCNSEYLVEFVRGEEDGDRHTVQSGLKEWFDQVIWNRGYVKLCKRYMNYSWGLNRSRSIFGKAFVACMGALIKLVCG